MTPRAGTSRTSLAVGLIALGAGALALELVHAGFAARAGQERMAASGALVRAAGLTDLALFTEARYTRNPALADLHTPFQDNPMSFEHFPSGTFAPIPDTLGRGALGFDQTEVAR